MARISGVISVFMYSALVMEKKLGGIFARAVGGVKGGFNYIAKKTRPARRRIDRKLERAPKLVSWPYRRLRYAYNASAGSTKALIVAGQVLGKTYPAFLGSNKDVATGLMVAWAACTVLGVGKFFAYDLPKKARARKARAIEREKFTPK